MKFATFKIHDIYIDQYEENYYRYLWPHNWIEDGKYRDGDTDHQSPLLPWCRVDIEQQTKMKYHLYTQ